SPLAKELIFTGRRLSAQDARQAGLVNHLVPAGQARAKAIEIAETISRNGPVAVRQAKKAIAYGSETDLDTGMVLAIEAYNVCVGTEDRLEGVRAYPQEFVDELTRAGYLAALIPPEYGGAGLGIREGGAILEEINHSGGTAAACHAQMYIMGTLLRHGSEEQKRRYLPRIASGE